MRPEQWENPYFGQRIIDGPNREIRFMRLLFVLSLALIFGCSVDNSVETANRQNENMSVSDLRSDVPSKNSLAGSPAAIEHGSPKKLNCDDPKGYSLVEVDNPSREHVGDSLSKDVNIVVDRAIVGKIELPSAEVKNFSLDSIKKTTDGFIVQADWGGWEHHYELKYFFVCKDQDFYFYKLNVNRINGKDPGDPRNWEKKEIEIEPNIPIEKFSILDYLGDK
jgi:hypothetical protein